MKRIFLLVLFLLPALIVAAQEKSYSDIKIKVLKEENSKPVRNATVVLHTLDEDGKSRGGINLKTDSDGETAFNNVPFGKLRIQVIARGRRTFGRDFDINQPSQEFLIKMQPPAEQYSIYEDRPEEKSPKKQ